MEFTGEQMRSVRVVMRSTTGGGRERSTGEGCALQTQPARHMQTAAVATVVLNEIGKISRYK